MAPTFLLIPALTSALLSLNPKGQVDEVPWRARATGFALPAETEVLFTTEKAGAWSLEIRAAVGVGDEGVVLTIVRDGKWQSRNELKFQKKRNRPNDYPLVAKLVFKVAAGSHTLALQASHPVVFLPKKGALWGKKFAAAPETEWVAPAAPVAATESPSTDSAVPGESVAAVAIADPIAALADMETPAAQAPSVETFVPPGETPIRVAVYNLEVGLKIGPTIGSVVTDSMLSEVRKLKGVSAIGMDEIEDMLSHEANKQMLGCDSSEECLAEIAGALGVDDLVTGKLAKIDDTHVLVVRRIDQNRALVVASVNKRLTAGSGEEFLLAIGPTVKELFPERALRDGATRGVPDEVSLRLNPPPLPTWAFWTAAGTTVAAAGVGSLFGLLQRSAQDDYQDYAALGLSQIIEGQTLQTKGDRVESHSAVANAAFLGAGTMLLTTAITYLFTDWQGYGKASESP